MTTTTATATPTSVCSHGVAGPWLSSPLGVGGRQVVNAADARLDGKPKFQGVHSDGSHCLQAASSPTEVANGSFLAALCHG